MCVFDAIYIQFLKPNTGFLCQFSGFTTDCWTIVILWYCWKNCIIKLFKKIWIFISEPYFEYIKLQLSIREKRPVYFHIIWSNCMVITAYPIRLWLKISQDDYYFLLYEYIAGFSKEIIQNSKRKIFHFFFLSNWFSSLFVL